MPKVHDLQESEGRRERARMAERATVAAAACLLPGKTVGPHFLLL